MSVEEHKHKIVSIEQFNELVELGRVARGYHNKCEKLINIVGSKFGDEIADIFTDVVGDDKPTYESLKKKLQFFGISIEGNNTK